MSILRCPNCKLSLQEIEKTVKCPNGHSFDISREGYINLLLANQKKKINSGDNKLMTNAREAFLAKGYYDVLIESIEVFVNEFVALNSRSFQLLDLGCGTGFYTRNLFKEKNIQKTGVDISKVAIAKAAVKDKEATYIIGSVFNLAIADSSVDLLINIFSPLSLEELKRVLKPGGYFVKVIPIGNHMREIAELVYETFIPHESNVKEEIEADKELRIIKTENLRKIILLSGEDLLNFVRMTPYLYKFKEGQLEQLTQLSVTLSFEIMIGQYIF